MELVNYHPKQLLIEVNSGSVNSELVEVKYPSLIRIPYVIGSKKLVTIQTKKKLPIE